MENTIFLNQMRSGTPQLELIKQTALTEEKITKNGQTQIVHVVVKNSPFQLLIGLRNAKVSNFNHLAFDIKLIYDVVDEKEVSFVKVKPVDYKPVVNDSGDQISFDVKIKVLSSHHEDNFFRLKIHVWDPLNLQFPQLQLLSGPIKVISKPLKHRKKTPAIKTEQVSNEEPGSPGSSEYVPPEVSSTPRKRTFNEAFMMEKLEAMELRQIEQTQLLKSIASGQVPDPNAEMSALLEEMGIPDVKRRKLDTEEKDFDSLISRTLQTYSSMSLEEKTERIRKMTRTMPSRDLEVLVEMIDMLNAVGLQREASKFMYNTQNNLNQPGTMNGFCTHTTDSCQHKLELQRMDQFYNEIFYS